MGVFKVIRNTNDGLEYMYTTLSCKLGIKMI